MSDVLPPPPPSRNSNDGCWKWGAISCAVGCGFLTLIIIIGIIAAGPAFKNIMGTAVKVGQEAELAEAELQNVWRQVDKYHKDKGKYPDKLEQLVPNYLPSEASLRFSRKPNGPMFTYYKPDKDTPGSATMLEYMLNFTVMDQTTQFPVQIHKDGEAVMQNRSMKNRRRPRVNIGTD